MSDRDLEDMERRLREWGTWLAAGCSTTSGYPTKSVLHPEWSPPASGSRPAMKVATVRDDREREMHGLVCQLSGRLQETLLARYVLNLSEKDRAQRLNCGVSTVRVRVMTAKRDLAAMLQDEEMIGRVWARILSKRSFIS